MPKLVIDDRDVEVPEGATVLDAARELGIAVPTLCHIDGRAPSTSCMACVVKAAGGLVPSCATEARDGMRVESETEEVLGARRAAIELLLSDHVGDCVGPCVDVCPARMNIPRMIRFIASGNMRDAIRTVKARIALPAVLGRICPAPCEKGCRRGKADAAVAICLLKRRAADADLASGQPYVPDRKPPSGKKVAVVGAGPAGLSAAYYLLRYGHACTIFDDRSEPGGMLRYGVDEKRLPRDVLDAEIETVKGLGAELRPNVSLGRDVVLDDLRREFDAVVIAAGEVGDSLDDALGEALKAGGVALTGRGVEADRRTLATSVPGVFAAGGAVRKSRMAVRACADGRAVAVSIDQLLSGRAVTGAEKEFGVHIGKLDDDEMRAFLTGASDKASDKARVEPAGGEATGLSHDEAVREARRCLRCDCRKADRCKLRTWAGRLGVKRGRFAGDPTAGGRRKRVEILARHADVIYEPGKCIACGICTRITAERAEPLGLTFVGRGFTVKVGVPFGRSVAEGLTKAAAECVEACPTGALAFKDRDEG